VTKADELAAMQAKVAREAFMVSDDVDGEVGQTFFARIVG